LQPLVVRAEIWGHANFDDGRLPALGLKALRGMRGLAAISDAANLTPNWFYQDGASQPAGAVEPHWPCLSFGNRSTTREPAPGVYYRAITFDSTGDTRVLHFPQLQVNARVFLGQSFVGQATPHNPWVDLSQAARAGESVLLAIGVDRQLRLAAGPLLLYQGQSIQEWELAGWGEADFARLAQRPAQSTAAVAWPYILAAGGMAWLRAQLPAAICTTAGLDLVFEGRGLKISAWLGERLVGRVWLPAQGRPRMAGGPDNRVALPAAWLQAAGGQLHLLIESTGEPDFGELTSIALGFEF
jgi:beta-galactosidase